MSRLLPVLLLTCLLMLLPLAAGKAAGQPDPPALLRQAVALACPEGETAGLLAALPGTRALVAEAGGPEPGSVRLDLPDGGLLELERLAPGGHLRRFTVTYEEAHDEGTRPRLLALADGGCRIVQGRALDWGAAVGPEAGGPDRLVLLDADLVTVLGSEPLDPPVPAGRDPGGVTVAHIDAGVAYDLPAIAERLARGPDGRPLGYDFWDLDPRPYDSHPSASPFFPARHGTQVASLLLAEAPAIRLLPYRYPRPHMDRMAELIGAAAGAGATIVALPMGSRSAELWEAFLAAAEGRPEMLFVVSAGNEGSDIERAPIWPAAASLENLLVVTSSEADGRLAAGSNWGAESVDLLVPAERLEVLDHEGRPALASGSSFAVPRVAALAARLQARRPDLQGVALKQAILALTAPAPQAAVVKVGWLRDPLAHP